MLFNEYISSVKQNVSYYCNYQGIKRKDFPKWQGWAFIDFIKNTQDVEKANSIQESYLDLLVENFYMIKFLEKLMNTIDDAENMENAEPPEKIREQSFSQSI